MCSASQSMKQEERPHRTRPILALDHALSRLEAIDAELAKLVELRAFGGLTIEEAAHVLEVSPSTAKRNLRTAKAWLKRELGPDLRP